MSEFVQFGSEDGMTCEIETCERRRKGGRLCEMHGARLRRNGDPMLKRRASGVMDAPVLTYVQERRLGRPRYYGPDRALAPRHARVVLALASGELRRYEDLLPLTGGSQRSLMQVVSKLRARFGFDIIETHHGVGYKLAGPLR